MMNETIRKIRITQAVVVEGRDDVDAVSRACEALIIPTHGFGISAETWGVIGRAYEEKGIIILTDPDFAGEQIRKRLTARFPEAIQCYMTKADTAKDGDIGIENASPADIAEALERALALSGRAAAPKETEIQQINMEDLRRLGLAGEAGASGLRAAVARELGTGYGNAKAMLTRLRGFGIGRDELEETVRRITQK